MVRKSKKITFFSYAPWLLSESNLFETRREILLFQLKKLPFYN